MEGSRPLSGVIMSLSDIYSATSHLPTRTVHQYPYSPRFSTESCLRIEQVGVNEKSTMYNCENTPKPIIFVHLSRLVSESVFFYFSTAAKLKLIRADILSGSPASCYDWPEGFSTHYTSCGAFDIQAAGDKVNYDDEGKDIEWGPLR